MTRSKRGNQPSRRGILCAGNWIIDHVKTVPYWPTEESLAHILSEELGGGGSPYNVLVDLARFDLGLPLFGLGVVGDDADGRTFLEECDRWGIDRRFLTVVEDGKTGYTDVITVAESGKRTFFTYNGTNALLSPADFPVEEMTCKVANLGYLLLLPKLDEEDSEYGTKAARVLARLRAHGILTSIDVVTEDSDRFRKIVTPSLPHADYCIINEIEAGKITGRAPRDGERLLVDELCQAALDLLDTGVHRQVVIHAPEGAVSVEHNSRPHWQPAHDIPAAEIRGAVGAGDAFLAGVLLGIHEGWEAIRSLRFAHAAAATCLSHPTATGGMRTAREIEEIMATRPLRTEK